MSTTALEFLLNAQHETGGWGYALGHTPVVEPTAAVLLAIRGEPQAAEAYHSAIDWLYKGQNPDGGWGMSHLDDESNWHTAWAVLALSKAGILDGAFDRGVSWLLNVETLWRSGESGESPDHALLAVDPAGSSWPWLPGEATWIEPTALAMLALEKVAVESVDPGRILAAVNYLEDRRCPGGGWTVGNPVMLETLLPALPHPTACALVALSTFDPEAITSEDVQVLRAEMHRDGGVLALAWGLLALRTLGEDDTQAQSTLDEMQGSDGGWNRNPYHTALAIMARRGYL